MSTRNILGAVIVQPKDKSKVLLVQRKGIKILPGGRDDNGTAGLAWLLNHVQQNILPGIDIRPIEIKPYATIEGWKPQIGLNRPEKPLVSLSAYIFECLKEGKPNPAYGIQHQEWADWKTETESCSDVTKKALRRAYELRYLR